MSIIEKYTSLLPPKYRWFWIVALLLAGLGVMKLVELSGKYYEERELKKEKEFNARQDTLAAIARRHGDSSYKVITWQEYKDMMDEYPEFYNIDFTEERN